MTATELVVVRAAQVSRHHINGQAAYGDFLAAHVQVTEVALAGVRAYVREGHRASSRDTFVMSSNARLRHKSEQHLVGHQVLYLAAPAKVWDRIAAAVASLDGKRRPVERHPRWTLNTAPEVMALGRPITERSPAMYGQKADSVARMTKKPLGPGRPARAGAGKTATERFEVRVTERELRAWTKAAGELSVSAWIRSLANDAAGVDVPSGAEPKED